LSPTVDPGEEAVDQSKAGAGERLLDEMSAVVHV